MYENINIPENCFTVLNDYFYYFDFSKNMLVVKTAGGKVVFMYALSVILDSPVISLDYDGAYFISLHKVDNVNFIRKWQLSHYICKLKEEYDYSNIGILSSKNIVFRKYFYNSITYDDWVLNPHPYNANFYIHNNELLVGYYGSRVSGYQGPYIDKYFNVVKSELKFKVKFLCNPANAHVNSNVKLNIHFKFDGTRQYELYLYAKSGRYKILFHAERIFSGYITINTEGYNILEIRKFNNYTYFILNDKVFVKTTRGYYWQTNYIHFGVTSLLGRSYDLNVFVINSLILNYYTSDYIVDTNTLAVDNYNINLALAISKNATTFKSYDFIPTGSLLRIENSLSSTYEEVLCSGIIINNIYGITSKFKYDHNLSADVSYAKNIYIFNRYQGTTVGGSIYKLNYTTGLVDSTYDSDDYYDISASCFFEYKGFYLLGYVHNTNFIQLNIDGLTLHNVLNMDNVEADNSTLIPIYDVKVNNNIIYRLQTKANYYSVNYSWSNYNYQLTPINSMIDSTTLKANPTIVNADAFSLIKVQAVTKDQYAEPLQSEHLYFYDDDIKGYMTIASSYTGLFGEAISYYRSGTEAKQVILSTEII
jgi:hypothetical protein